MMYAFGSYQFDQDKQLLYKKSTAIKLRPKAAEVLGYLLQHHARTVTKEELFEQFWRDINVSENVLFQCIREIRASLKSQGSDEVFIKTVPKQGYRWVFEPVTPVNVPAKIQRPKLQRFTWPLLAAVFLLCVVTVGWTAGRQNLILEPRTIGVLPLRDASQSGEFNWMGQVAEETLNQYLREHRDFQLIPSERMAQTSLDLSLPGGSSPQPADLKRVGQLSGCELIWEGSYQLHQEHLRVILSLREAATGKQLDSFMVETPVADTRRFVNKLDRSLRKRIGNVAHYKASRVPEGEDALRFYTEGVYHLRRRDVKAAIPFLEKVVSADPKWTQGSLALSRAYGMQGRRPQAIEAARLAADYLSNLDEETRLRVEARIHETEDAWAQAAELYQGLLQRFPSRTDYHLLLIEAQIKAGQAPKASQALEQLAEKGQNPLFLELTRARIAKVQSDFHRQRQLAERAVRTGRILGARSAVAEGLLLMAQADRENGDFKAAAKHLEEATQLFHQLGDFSGYAGALSEQGKLHHMQGQIESARGYYQQAMQHYQLMGDVENEAKLTLNMGVTYYGKRDFKQAAALYEEANRRFAEIKSPNEAKSSLNLSAVLPNLGRFEEAVQVSERASQLFLEQGNLNLSLTCAYNMAISLEQQGEWERTEETLRWVIQQAESNNLTSYLSRYKANLGGLMTKRARLQEARVQLTEASRILEQEGRKVQLSQVYGWLGNCAAWSGDHQEAVSYFEKGLALANETSLPTWEQMELNIIKAHHGAGEMDKALARFNEVIQSTPGKWRAELLAEEIHLLRSLERYGEIDNKIHNAYEACVAGKHHLTGLHVMVPYYLRKQQPQQAREHLEKVREQISMKPIFVQLRFRLLEASVLMAEGKAEPARSMLESIRRDVEDHGIKGLMSEVQDQLAML